MIRKVSTALSVVVLAAILTGGSARAATSYYVDSVGALTSTDGNSNLSMFAILIDFPFGTQNYKFSSFVIGADDGSKLTILADGLSVTSASSIPLGPLGTILVLTGNTTWKGQAATATIVCSPGANMNLQNLQVTIQVGSTTVLSAFRSRAPSSWHQDVVSYTSF